MSIKKLTIFLLIFYLFISCSKEEVEVSGINEKSLELQVLEAYKEGIRSLEEGDVIFAAKKFNEVETLFPQSVWAPKSSLMAAYSYYIQDYYPEAIAELERFNRVYPNHENLDYVNYMLALCYYEQIVDETKDLRSILRAKEKFQLLIKNYPDTEYSIDAKFKIDLIDDILAAKELYIGRYYLNKKKWISAINRFKVILDEYDRTIYVEEALHRLVEVYYILGLENEAKKYAKLLGYNYNSSRWYKQTYSIFDKKYKINQKKNKKNKEKSNLIKKFKSMFE